MVNDRLNYAYVTRRKRGRGADDCSAGDERPDREKR